MVDEKDFAKCKDKTCNICGMPVYDPGTAQYIRTKLKNHILLHNECVAKITGNNSKKLFA